MCAARKENAEKVERLGRVGVGRPKRSPVTGEPMDQVVISGVVVDRCPSSGGVWLDAGELEQIIQHRLEEEHESKPDNLLTRFLEGLAGYYRR